MFFLLLWLTFSLIAQEQNEPTNEKPHYTVQQVVLQTIVNQKTDVQTNAQDLFGKRLVSYLNNLDDEEFKKTFK